jgi:hypothetical protein
MTPEYLATLDVPRQQAVADLSLLIRARYPTVALSVGPAPDEPGTTHITAVVDLDDPDELTDLTIERELAYQLEEGIPVYVIPRRTPERTDALRTRLATRRHRPLTLPPLPLPSA